MCTAPDQYPFLVRTALSPQAGICFHRYHPTHYYTQGTGEIQKLRMTAPKGKWKKIVGRYDE
jgi:hypothetical protein